MKNTIIATCAIGASAICCLLIPYQLRLFAQRTTGQDGQGDPTKLLILVDYPGIVDPQFHGADEVEVPDGSDVIAVCVGEDCRAYLLGAMCVPTDHIVNDVIGDIPVSVAFCDLANATRVVTNEQAGKPIELSVGGKTRDDLMLFLFQGKRFRMDSQDLPLADFPYERITWGEFKRKHPHGRLYEGKPATEL